METVSNQKRFIQVFHNHMREEDKPKITKATRSKEYTSITFQPDLALFGMSELDDDTLAIIRRRVIDCAGVTDGVKVYWNGARVDVNDFRDYVMLFSVAVRCGDSAVESDSEQRRGQGGRGRGPACGCTDRHGRVAALAICRDPHPRDENDPVFCHSSQFM